MIEVIADSINKIVITLVAIAPVVVAQVKQYKTSRKENKILMDSVKELYVQNENISADVLEHKKVTNFNLSLRTAIQSRASQAIAYSKLEQCHKSIMKEYSKRIEQLAFGFYYNKNRGIEFEMTDYIDVEISDIKECISDMIKDVKMTENSKIIGWDAHENPKIIYFHEFVLDEKNRTPWINLYALQNSLIKNGFDDKDDKDSPDFILTMTGYTKNILNNYVNSVEEWAKIKEIPEPPSKQMTKYA